MHAISFQSLARVRLTKRAHTYSVLIFPFFSLKLFSLRKHAKSSCLTSLLCVITLYYVTAQFLKLEDVGDQIRIEEWHIQQRGSLVARLLHYTIDHSRQEQREDEEFSVEEEIQDSDKIQERTIAETNDSVSLNAVM